MFDLIMLWWVLPSCIVFLTMIGRVRSRSTLTTKDWGFTTLFSVLWPFGAIVMVLAWMEDIYLQYKARLAKVGGALAKERKL